MRPSSTCSKAKVIYFCIRLSSVTLALRARRRGFRASVRGRSSHHRPGSLSAVIGRAEGCERSRELTRSSPHGGLATDETDAPEPSRRGCADDAADMGAIGARVMKHAGLHPGQRQFGASGQSRLEAISTVPVGRGSRHGGRPSCESGSPSGSSSIPRKSGSISEEAGLHAERDSGRPSRVSPSS